MCEASESTELLGNRDKTSAQPHWPCNIASHVVLFCLGLAFAIFSGLPNQHHHAGHYASHEGRDELHIDDISSKYTHFQGLGYEIYTGGAPAFISPGVKNPECVGLGAYGEVDGDLQCYLGLKDDKDDVIRRLNIMKAALEKAYLVADQSNTTLKLFIAPEFFFRGKNGAYNISREYDDPECHAVCQSLLGLESLVADKRFEDWLFLFGTVIASDTLPSDHEFEYVFVNFAPLYKGYNPDSTSHLGKRLIVPKRYVSREDFLTTRRRVNESSARQIFDDPLPYQATVLSPFDIGYRQYNNDQWKKYKGALSSRGYAMVEFDFFIMDNITFSIEICLDHDKHSALDVFMANLVTGSKKRIPSGGSGDFTYRRIPDHQAQISLISSGGITVNPESLVLANNGSIFLQDGLTNATSLFFWNEECEIGKLAFDGGSELVSRFAVLTATEVFFEYRLTSAKKKQAIYETEQEWKQALRGTFSTHQYKPVINVYKPLVIALPI